MDGRGHAPGLQDRVFIRSPVPQPCVKRIVGRSGARLRSRP